MSSAPSGEISKLSREILLAYHRHQGSFFESLDLGVKRAGQMHQDLTGEEIDYAQPFDGDFLAELGIAFDADVLAHPEQETARNANRKMQLALEARLGKILASDAPEFVVMAIGDPPKPSATPRVSCKDSRGWLTASGDAVLLTPRQLWERTAGAYVGLVCGRRVTPAQDNLAWDQVQPNDIHQAWTLANTQQHTLDGNVAAVHFREVMSLTMNTAIVLGHSSVLSR